MNPDGVSYLDMGDAMMEGNWSATANAYWSPLYPLLLGIAMRLIRPSLWWQFPLAHLVNFIVFSWALFCFRHFMSCLVAEQSHGRLPDWFLRSSGYALFLWCSLDLIGVQIVTPDLLLSSWIFLLAGLLVRLRHQGSKGQFLLFGIVLGAAYLTKGFMFPLGLIVLAILFFSGSMDRRHLGNLAYATSAFAVISLPWIGVLSHAKGRPTFSDAGRLTYAWLVNPQTPIVNAQTEHACELLHPTRKILARPPVYEFAEPIAGTYPPWYDPSYWNDGLKPRFQWGPQIQTISRGAGVYWRLLLEQWGWFAGSLIFLVLTRKRSLANLLEHWPLFAMTLGALVMYSCILVMPRYPAPFLTVLCFVVLTAITQPQRLSSRTVELIAVGTLFAMLAGVAKPLAAKSYGRWSGNSGSSQELHHTAEVLLRLGLKPGDRVVIVGDGISDYWSRLAGLKVVAQIMSGGEGKDQFWRLTPDERLAIYETLRSTGARALVVHGSGPTQGGDLLHIDGTPYHVRFLKAPGT